MKRGSCPPTALRSGFTITPIRQGTRPQAIIAARRGGAFARNGCLDDELPVLDVANREQRRWGWIASFIVQMPAGSGRNVAIGKAGAINAALLAAAMLATATRLSPAACRLARRADRSVSDCR